MRSADNLRSRGKTWRLAVTSLASCLLDSGALEGAPEVTWFAAFGPEASRTAQDHV